MHISEGIVATNFNNWDLNEKITYWSCSILQVVAVSQDFELIAELGADVVLDHTDPDYQNQLRSLGSFDVVFDFAGLGQESASYIELLRPWSNAKLVTLMSPLLRSTDQDGLFPGTIKTMLGLATKNIQSVFNNNGSTFRYGYFMPNPYALKTIAKMVEKGKVSIIFFSLLYGYHRIAL